MKGNSWDWHFGIHDDNTTGLPVYLSDGRPVPPELNLPTPAAPADRAGYCYSLILASGVIKSLTCIKRAFLCEITI